MAKAKIEHPRRGPETPDEVIAMLDRVDQEFKSESDPEWFAK